MNVSGIFLSPTCFRSFVADEILFCVKLFFAVVLSSTLWVDNCCVSHGDAACCAIVWHEGFFKKAQL